MNTDQQRLDERFPPTIPAAVQSVATFIPSRSPEFKVHTKPGLAHSALGGRGFASEKAKYELIDGEWQRVWGYVPPNNCRRCGRKYADVLAEERRQAQANGRYHYGTKYYSDPTYDGPKWCEEPVCKICNVQIRQEADKAEQEEAARIFHELHFAN